MFIVPAIAELSETSSLYPTSTSGAYLLPAGDILSLLPEDGSDTLAPRFDNGEMGVVLHWYSPAEWSAVGFRVERNNSESWVPLNGGALLPARINAPRGAAYLWVDPSGPPPGGTRYRVVEKHATGTQRTLGPWSVQTGAPPGINSDNSKHWRSVGEGFAVRVISVQSTANEVVRSGYTMFRSSAGAFTSAAAVAAAPGNQVGAARLRTQAEGLHQISTAQLAQVLTVKEKKLHRLLKKSKIRLREAGVNKPYYYHAPTRTLSFAANYYRSRESEENVYQVDKAAGLKMRKKKGGGPLAGTPGVFKDSLYFEDNAPDLLLPHWEDNETADFHWWDWFYPPYENSREVEILLPDPAASGAATLRISLYGGTDEAFGDDHRVSVSLNGQPQPPVVEWDGRNPALLEVSFDASLLTPGANGTAPLQITLVGEALNGAPYSAIFLQSIEVTYPRRMRARNGQLWLHNAAAGTQTVSGFASNSIQVMELDGTPRWRTNLTIGGDGQGGWQVSFKAVAGSDYLISDTPLTPVAEIDSPSALTDSNNQSEYLIIAPRSLAQGAQAMQNYRAQTHIANIVWLQDIYDEFAWGRTSSAAVDAFLAYAHSAWTQPPTYVLLLGRGTQDHADRLGLGESLIPIRMVSTPWGLVGGDNRYADADGDSLPEYRLGRLSVQTDAQAIDYVTKLQGFESQPAAGWTMDTLIAADNPDAAGDFHADADIIAQMIEGWGYGVDKLYHSQDPLRSGLISGLDAGDYAYVNYIGHGLPTLLGDERFLEVADVPGLSNGSQLPILTALSCAVGNSNYPGQLGLSDSLVQHAGGGAIAAFSATGLSLHYYAQLMNADMMASLLGAGTTVGEAGQAARQNPGILPYMLDIYQIQGCPAVKLIQ